MKRFFNQFFNLKIYSLYWSFRNKNQIFRGSDIIQLMIINLSYTVVLLIIYRARCTTMNKVTTWYIVT